jgi:hypothetical protein
MIADVISYFLEKRRHQSKNRLKGLAIFSCCENQLSASRLQAGKAIVDVCGGVDCALVTLVRSELTFHPSTITRDAFAIKARGRLIDTRTSSAIAKMSVNLSDARLHWARLLLLCVCDCDPLFATDTLLSLSSLSFFELIPHPPHLRPPRSLALSHLLIRVAQKKRQKWLRGGVLP